VLKGNDMEEIGMRDDDTIEITDLIKVYQDRDDQSRKDLAVRDALIMGLRRRVADAEETVLGLQTALADQSSAPPVQGEVIDVGGDWIDSLNPEENHVG
jgi:hypothetical protein